MTQNIIELIRKNKNHIFTQLVSLYIYMLYIRIIYLSYKDICIRINNDYYNYLLNKKHWLFENSAIHIDVFAILILSVVISASCYLCYKKNHYFYAILLFPIFLGLSLIAVTSLYMLLNQTY